MAVTATDRELLRYVLQLNESQKQSLVELIRTFIISDQHYENVTIRQYNEELEAAVQNFKEGNFTTLEELEKEMQAW